MVAKDFKGAPRGTLGRHVVAEFIDCNPARLENEGFLKRHAASACRQAGATVLGVHSHKFEPQGATVLVLLAESHLSIHTWPEYAYAAVDVFTCGESLRPEEAVYYLAEKLGATRCSILTLHRGCHAKRNGSVVFAVPALEGTGPVEAVRRQGARDPKSRQSRAEAAFSVAWDGRSAPTS